MSTPETRQPCQAGPARTGRTGLGANGSALVPKLLGGHGLRAILGVTPQLGDSAARTPQNFSRAQGISWHQAGFAGGKMCLGGEADGAFTSPFSGLHCLLNSERVAAPLGNRGRCDPRAVSTVPYPVRLGSISWCSRTPQGLEQAFCKGPASPCDRCPTASQGKRGHAARQHVAATLCCPHLSLGPWGACHKAEGDKTEPGCVGMEGHSLCCPWGSRSPVGTAGWLKGCCHSGMGTARGRAQLRLPPGQLSGSGWLSTVGKHFGAGASKSSPAVSGDPKGMEVPGTALCHVPERCQPPAGPRQLPRSCASAGGMCSVLAVKMCQHPATGGGHGKVLARPVGGPPSGDVVPGAVTHPPLFAQPARALARGSRILFAKCLERLG